METSAPENKVSGLRIRHVRVRNLRKVAELDLRVPEATQCICFVGPNGGGKSSVLSQIIHSLKDFTGEETFDSKEDADGTLGLAPAASRSWSTNEVGSEGRLLGFRLDWGYGEREFYQARVVSRGPLNDPANSRDMTDLEAFLQVGGVQAQLPTEWLWQDGQAKVQGEHDAVARSVFLERPAERFELPYYSEAQDLSAQLSLHANWAGRRLMPIRVARGVPVIEKLILDFAVDATLAERTRPGAGSPAATALNTIMRALRELLGEGTLVVPPWPYRRVGFRDIAAISLLSAGELDVLVTICLIAAQRVYIQRKFGDSVPGGGVVFIDEVDAHLHPAWQQTALPLLCDLFPDIQFVVTTHSPFVLRSLPVGKCLVVRLPDGRVFDQEFSSWSVEDILRGVFDVAARWSPTVEGELATLQRLAADDTQREEVVRLYRELARRGEPLRAAADKVIAVAGSIELRDYLGQHHSDDAEAAS